MKTICLMLFVGVMSLTTVLSRSMTRTKPQSKTRRQKRRSPSRQ